MVNCPSFGDVGDSLVLRAYVLLGDGELHHLVEIKELSVVNVSLQYK
jgi:hypothetical protein